MSTEQTTTAPPPQPVLESYVQRMRRLRRWYLLAVAVVVCSCVVVAVVVMNTGEIAHVHLRTAASAAPTPAQSPVPSQLSQAWSSTDRAAIGQPVVAGTVVTFAGHTVTGRSAATGDPLWSLTRSDRLVCDVVTESGHAIALFERDGNCDEVDALDAQTGARVWQRTLDTSGMPVNGRPQLIALPDTLVVWTPAVVYAIGLDSGGCHYDGGSGCGFDRWEYQPPAGCTIGGVAYGNAGALIGLGCADGSKLVLRSRDKGNDDKDKIVWTVNVAPGPVPVAAGAFVGALNPVTGELSTYASSNGAGQRVLRLGSTGAAADPMTTLDVPGGVVISLRGQVFGVSGTAVAWRRAADGSPTLTDDGTGMGYLASGAGVEALNLQTGTSSGRYTLPAAIAAGSRVYRLGGGLLAAGPATTAYR